MLVKISKLWFEEVATTGNTDLTLSSFVTKLFKEGNLYKENKKVDSIFEALITPEIFSAQAEVKLGKSILKKENLEVLKFDNTKDALDWLAKCTDNASPFGPNGSDAFAPFYISTDGCNFKMIVDCKTHQGIDHQRNYHSYVTLPDFVGDFQFTQLNENEIKNLCKEMCFPVEAYIKEEKKEKKEVVKESKTFLDETPDLYPGADEQFEQLMQGIKKEKTPKFKMDPLPEKIWMKKKKESGDHPNRFKRERLYRGSVSLISRPDLGLEIFEDGENLTCIKNNKLYATWSKELGVVKPNTTKKWDYADFFVGGDTLSKLTKEETKKLFKYVKPDPGFQPPLAFEVAASSKDVNLGINFYSAAKEAINKGLFDEKTIDQLSTCDVCDEENITVASVPEPMKLNCKSCSCPPDCNCECTETECQCSDGKCSCTCTECKCEKHEEVRSASKSSREEALDLAKSRLEKRASVTKEAYSIFENYGETVKCPNCAMEMVKIKLASGLSGIFCTTCKHTDYDGKIKSRVNAGNPSVEKKITLNCLDSGNCEIKR